MSWETSDVMSEFLKIAEKQDVLGLQKTAMPEKNPYQEDDETIREKRLKSPEKSIIEIAHPEPVFTAESRGEGALVENELEQQRKTIEIVNKMPTGSLVGRYAYVINQMVKLAETCDQIGQTEAADLLTEATGSVIAELQKPFFE